MAIQISKIFSIFTSVRLFVINSLFLTLVSVGANTERMPLVSSKGILF